MQSMATLTEKLLLPCIVLISHITSSIPFWTTWTSNVAIQHQDSNTDQKNLQAPVCNTGPLFSPNNPTWVGYHNEQRELRYTKQPNNALPDQKFYI